MVRIYPFFGTVYTFVEKRTITSRNPTYSQRIFAARARERQNGDKFRRYCMTMQPELIRLSPPLQNQQRAHTHCCSRDVHERDLEQGENSNTS